MPESVPALDSRGIARRILPLAAIIVVVGAAYLASGGVSVRHRATIDDFVASHRLLAVLSYMGLYIVVVALSVPGAVFLTVTGGSSGLRLAPQPRWSAPRSAPHSSFSQPGRPLAIRCCGAPGRARTSWPGIRDDAFSYLLFLRLVPAFPFFLVNLVPAFAGVRLGPFIAATAIGIIPGAIVFALAGVGLDSMIAAQKNSYDQCIAASGTDCRLAFDPADVLTPQLIAALVALGLLALMPVVVKYWRARSRTAA